MNQTMSTNVKHLYAVLLRCEGKVVKISQRGNNYLVTTERPVEQENMNTGERCVITCTERFALCPK